jgi:hypothetical protein
VAHLDGIQRTWQVDLPPSQATVRVADLLRAYGGRITLQAGDFVASEFDRGVPRWSWLAAAATIPAISLVRRLGRRDVPTVWNWVAAGAVAVPLRLLHRTDVVTAESLRSGAGSEVTITASGDYAQTIAADLGHQLDVDKRPVQGD